MSYVPKFFELYSKLMEDTEPTPIYHQWVAISLVAACIGPKMWVWYGNMHIPLRQYIMLSGPSGRRKSTAITLGMELVHEVGGEMPIIPLSSDSVTRESLMLEMEENTMDFEIEGLQESFKSSAILALAPDFFAFFRRADRDFLTWLVNIYDEKKGRWKYSTKGSGSCTLWNPSLNLLGATTPEGLGEAVPVSAIGSGFTARMHFVHSDALINPCSFPQADPALAELRTKIKGYLLSFTQRTGQIHWTSEAMEYFSSWYSNFKLPPDIHSSIISWYDRYSNFLIRLAGIACVANVRLELKITVEDLKWAQGMLDRIAKDMSKTFATLGRSRLANVQMKLMDKIQNSGTRGIARAALMNEFLGDAEPMQFDSILQELELRSKLIISIPAPEGIRYVWKKKHQGDEDES